MLRRNNYFRLLVVKEKKCVSSWKFVQLADANDGLNRKRWRGIKEHKCISFPLAYQLMTSCAGTAWKRIFACFDRWHWNRLLVGFAKLPKHGFP